MRHNLKLVLKFPIDQDTRVYHVAQEAGTPHLWVINRKNNNAVFTYAYCSSTIPYDFCSGNASQPHHLTFQILTKSPQTFPRNEPVFRQGVKVAIKHKCVVWLVMHKILWMIYHQPYSISTKYHDSICIIKTIS